LIRLRVTSLALEIDLFLDPGLAKDVMAAPHPHLKAEATEQVAHIVKPDVRVGSSAEHPWD